MMGWERHINMKVHLSGPSNLQMQASASWIWMIWCIICLSSGEMCNQCSWGSSKLNNLFLQFMFWCNFSRSLLCFLLDCRYLEQCIWWHGFLYHQCATTSHSRHWGGEGLPHSQQDGEISWKELFFWSHLIHSIWLHFVDSISPSPPQGRGLWETLRFWGGDLGVPTSLGFFFCSGS